jgi:hypothetical protein
VYGGFSQLLAAESGTLERIEDPKVKCMCVCVCSMLWLSAALLCVGLLLL